MEAFPEYTVFIGGTSSYDMAPAPYNKLYALEQYCTGHNLTRQDVVFFGDDWEPGGGDRQVYTSDIPFVVVDDYRKFTEKARFLLK
jgi:hydroxymethylpyrimidine pyrophosphatase-like HAD family hydrolase